MRYIVANHYPSNKKETVGKPAQKALRKYLQKGGSKGFKKKIKDEEEKLEHTKKLPDQKIKSHLNKFQV